MSKNIFTLMVLGAVACLFPSCKGHNPSGPTPVSALAVNGTSVTGNVEIGSVRIYTLSTLSAGNQYLVRTVIAPGGTLNASVYTSFAAYKAGEPAVVTATEVVPDFYEASFPAAQSGDYVVVLSGTPAVPSTSSLISTLYFYGLRVMSATGPALTSFQTPTVDLVLATGATATGTVYPDSLIVYSGATITPPGTYSILVTSSTVTLSAPQMFVYGDSSLSLQSLLYSVTSTSPADYFTISDFTSTSGTLSTFPTSSYLSSTATISAVSFPTSSGGPFIMLKGVSQATYTVQVGPSHF